MRRLFVLEEEVFHRVWNFVVPLHKLSNNSRIKSIPPLTKKYSKKNRKNKKKSAS